METIIIQTIQPILVSLLTAAVAAVAGMAANWFRKKTGIEISQGLIDKAQQSATSAVLAAEEKGCAAAVKWSGEQKLGFATTMLLKAVPSVSHEEADALIHAALAKVPALGASGDLKVVQQ